LLRSSHAARTLEEARHSAAEIGQRRAAELEIAQLVVARSANTFKGHLLVAGLAFEVLGVVAVAVGVLLILT
jgi:hypothetical protein